MNYNYSCASAAETAAQAAVSAAAERHGSINDMTERIRISLAAGPAPVEVTEPETGEKTSIDRPWNVIVWNDPITLMSYVVYVFQKLFGYPRAKATRLMLEVHHRGKSIVATVDREKAEYYVARLHGFGLQATLEQTG